MLLQLEELLGAWVMSNIDQEELCPECGVVAILDGEARICYECWNNLVIAEAEEE